MFTLHFQLTKQFITQSSLKRQTFKNENSPPDFEPIDLVGCKS